MKLYARACTMALLLLFALGSQDSSLPVTHCCFAYSSKRIPFRLLVDYYKTSVSCSLPAIVFITRKGRYLCANPTDRWVQIYVNRLSQSSTETSTISQ